MLSRSRGDDVLLDVVAAVLLGLLGASSLYGAGGSRPADLVGVVLVLTGALCLVMARRHPLPVLAVTLATSLAVAQLDYSQQGLGLTVLWALYVVAVRMPHLVSLAATAIVLVLVNVSLTTTGDTTAANRISATVVLGAGWAVGRANRSRHSRREAEERAAVAEERAVVAREMQDLLAHELAEMTVQVTAARRMVARDPEATEQLLAGAETTARTVVTEARRILALLAPDVDEMSSRRPLPGLDDIQDLARWHSQHDLPVELNVSVPDRVASGPGLLAYRTVEDALAEAHSAGATHATVSVAAHSCDLRVAVRHDGAAVAESTSAGTLGLQRRVQLYGGWLQRSAGAGDHQTVVLEIPAAGTRRVTT